MTEPEPTDLEMIEIRDSVAPESVLIRPRPSGAIGRAAGSPPALALVSLIVATATLLSESVTTDLANAHFYSSRHFNNLAVIRWSAGSRLVIAGVALLLAVIAGGRYARSLPATRYTFSADGEEAEESIEGTDAPTWLAMLIGASFLAALIGIILNGLALVLTLRLHESPNFGIPS